MNRYIKSVSLIFSISIILMACGGEKKEATTLTPNESETPSQMPSEVSPETTTPVKELPTTADDAVAVIVLNAGDDMKFDKTELKVKEGQKVKLTLNHTGKMDKRLMGHNFVLVPTKMDIQMFAQVAIKAVDNEYIPASEAAQIIAYTKLIGGGESTTIEFDAPSAGVYKYLCTFPGHWAAMQGKFIVE